MSKLLRMVACTLYLDHTGMMALTLFLLNLWNASFSGIDGTEMACHYQSLMIHLVIWTQSRYACTVHLVPKVDSVVYSYWVCLKPKLDASLAYGRTDVKYLVQGGSFNRCRLGHSFKIESLYLHITVTISHVTSQNPSIMEENCLQTMESFSWYTS